MLLYNLANFVLHEYNIVVVLRFVEKRTYITIPIYIVTVKDIVCL